MRLIHKVAFTPEEIESFRQLVFNNLMHGMRLVFEALHLFQIGIDEANLEHVPLIESAQDLKDGEPFPIQYCEPLKALWADQGVQAALHRGNEVALPENLRYFFPQIDRFFVPTYRPTDQDILHCRSRSTGIVETIFKLKTHDLHLLDVGGQKSERRKWIHCFEDVTSILFLVSLNGYDMSLTEDRDANQMQDAMAIWDSICHSQWFKTTSIILFLNKLDLFTEKVQHSDIKAVFPDYDGKPKDMLEGREYFRKRFLRLAQKSSRTREREIYVHFTNATDTALLRVVMAAVEDSTFKVNLKVAALI
jgi:guanine nucleotide-binding protein subunit alpha